MVTGQGAINVKKIEIEPRGLAQGAYALFANLVDVGPVYIYVKRA